MVMWFLIKKRTNGIENRALKLVLKKAYLTKKWLFTDTNKYDLKTEKKYLLPEDARRVMPIIYIFMESRMM